MSWLLEQIVTRPGVSLAVIVAASAASLLLRALFRAQQLIIERGLDPAWQDFTTAMRSDPR